MSLGGAEGAVIMELIPGVITMYEGITGLNLIGATLSSGIFIGIGIIYGHELSHTKGFGFTISRLMMGLSGSAHFCYVPCVQSSLRTCLVKMTLSCSTLSW